MEGIILGGLNIPNNLTVKFLFFNPKRFIGLDYQDINRPAHCLGRGYNRIVSIVTFIAEWCDSFDRDRRKRTREGLESVGLTNKDLTDLAQEWDDLIKDAAYPEREIPKNWHKEEQEEEEAEHPE